MVDLYKTYSDYPNASGINKIAYPLRDSITLINPFFVILFGIFLVLTAASYYVFTTLSGKTRIINSILASSFVTTLISFLFAFDELISPMHVMTFLSISLLCLIISIIYR